jgi:adenylate kinase
MDIIILLGAPGAGKGTVAARLVKRLNLKHISSGDLLRAAVKQGTPAGKEAEGYMKRGELVPDALIGRIIADVLAAGGGDATYLLDGFPRTVAQASMLDGVVAEQGGRIRGAVLLDVAEDILVDRLAGRRVCPKCAAGYHVRNLPPKVAGVCDVCGAALVQRPDDNPETVRNRLAVYAKQTAPLIAWYQARQSLARVDGASGSADDIAERVARLLP